MKKLFCSLVPVVVLGSVVTPLRAADETKPPVKEERRETRVLSGGGGGGMDHGTVWAEHRVLPGRAAKGGEMETVTFLGIETAPVSPTITAQLGLADGTGLIVAHVVPDSPAAGVLKEHDVLLKLDDQVLIEQRQLSVLIRNHKEGDEVVLSYLRGGKPATAKVKLVKHEVPKMAMLPNMPGTLFGAGRIDPFSPNPDGAQSSEIFERMLPLMDGVKSTGVRRFQLARPGGPGPGPGERDISVTVNTANSHLVLDDDQGSIELTIKEGAKELVAKNAKGEQVFAGPVNTPDERRALPPEVRKRLEGLEDTTQFSFRPDESFKTETRVMPSRGQGIAVPPAAPTPVNRRSMAF